MRKLTKTEMVDGFDADIDEEDGGGPPRVVQGVKVRFTNDYSWVDANEDEIPPDRELIVADRQRVLQKWGTENVPIESRFLEPHEKWPDIEALNNMVPKSEWREAFGNLVGPWSASWILYLLNPLTGDKYMFVTGTTGGHMAVGELSDKIKVMRRLRGARVYPVVNLSTTHMPTRFGNRERPHFKVVRWIGLDGDAALPTPEETRALPTQEQAPKATGMKVVKEPTTEEVLGDKIRF
jgi:hypothetical protein